MNVFSKAALKLVRFAGLVFLAIFLSMCTGRGSGNHAVVGGPCAYHAYPGTATFTALTNVVGGVKASFFFTPADPNARSTYRVPSADREIVLHARDGSLPSADWLASKGISVGAQLSASRNEIRTGTCTPLEYYLPSLPGFYG